MNKWLRRQTTVYLGVWEQDLARRLLLVCGRGGWAEPKDIPHPLAVGCLPQVVENRKITTVSV